MDLSSLTKSDRKRLKEFSDKGGLIAIYDGEKIIYFSGDTPERKKNIKRKKFDEKIYEYTYTPKANVSEGRTAIRLKGKIDQNVKTYYVYCSVKLRTLENSIGLISRFMLVEMIIILILVFLFHFIWHRGQLSLLKNWENWQRKWKIMSQLILKNMISLQ